MLDLKKMKVENWVNIGFAIVEKVKIEQMLDFVRKLKLDKHVIRILLHRLKIEDYFVMAMKPAFIIC